VSDWGPRKKGKASQRRSDPHLGDDEGEKERKVIAKNLIQKERAIMPRERELSNERKRKR